MKKLKLFFTLKIIILFIFYSSISFSQNIETPQINYITVNHLTGKPVISWNINNPNIIDGYIIKRYILSCSLYNPNWHTIATINSSNQFLFEDNTTDCEAKPNERIEKYSLRAFKITGSDIEYSTISNYHQTIFLEASYNYCEKSNYLKWNNYVGWGSNFYKYEIFYKNNTGNFIKIGTNNFNDTIFTHLNVENNTNYEYYIKAIRNDAVESNSNIAQIFTKSINFPKFLKTDSLIVDENINLFYKIDSDADAKRYILYKSSFKQGTYDSISQQKQLNNNILYFIDKYEKKRNYYYLCAKDYCNDNIFFSDTISNIQLKADKKNDLEKIVNLQWDNEIGLNYIILRCEKPNNLFSEIYTTPFLTYNDNVQNIYENQFQNSSKNGEFCYIIKNDIENFVNKSNIACVKFDEKVFIANALNPKSNIEENRTFKPKIAFVQDYELIIYGNFGDIIFKTNNPNIGWDGNMPNGKLAQRASYLYYLSYINSFGKKVIKKGFVSLVY